MTNKKKTLECNICMTTNKLVRDHDHSTGFIRGILCEKCNSWLGVYENNLNRKIQRGRSEYKKWALRYRAKIKKHLKSNTGIVYKANAGFSSYPNPYN